ncbi:hypothetical protein H0H93_009536 [Arthromyces matolae]|nr:hypothetical protein H0H93_009536 [Arthromyces matolae]
MAAHAPVRMPSNEWVGKDRPAYVRSPSSLRRNQVSSKNPFANEPTKQFGESNIGSSAPSGEPMKPVTGSAFLPGQLHTSLPSNETPSGSAIGVGSLPGHMSESSVAKLPAEREMEAHQKQIVPPVGPKSDPFVSKKANNTNITSASSGAGSAPAPSELPSKEIPSISRGGVGSLPGTISEVSVAKLPEERRLEGMPSHESDHELLGKSGGVGPLPGGPNESRVAMLPEERLHPQYDTRPMGASGSTASPLSIGGTKSSVRTGSPLKQVTISTPDDPLQETTAIGLGAAGVGAGVAGAGAMATHQASSRPGAAAPQSTGDYLDNRLDPGYHPAELHPLDPKFNQKSSDVPSSSHHEALPTDTKESSELGTSATRRSSAGSEERRKVKLLEKVKGEAKVISGKLSHNEKKIEEGRQMMGK